MMNPQEAINRELIAANAQLSKQLLNLVKVINELKRRQALMDRMATVHHFAIVGLMTLLKDIPAAQAWSDNLRELAKKAQIKLDPYQPNEEDNGSERVPD